MSEPASDAIANPTSSGLLKWFLIALVVRLLAAFAMNWYLDLKDREFAIPGDANGYWDLAETIVNGTDFTIHSPPRRVLRTPGFPTLLAIAQWTGGNSKDWARYVVAAFCALAVPAVGWLAALLGYTARQQKWGMICAALHPWLIATSPLLLSDTPFGTLLVLSFACLICMYQSTNATSIRSQIGLIFVCALCGYIAIMIRPSWVLFVGMATLLGPLIAGNLRLLAFRYLQSLAYLACLSLLFTPWIVRNYFVTNHFVPLSLWVGPSLYDGLNPQATGLSDMRFFDDNPQTANLSEYEVNQFYTRMALEWAASHPLKTLQLAAVKQCYYWGLFPTELGVTSPLLGIALGLSSLMVVAFLMVGLIRSREFKRPVLLAAPIVYFALLHCLFVGSIRYRLPTELPLMIVAGMAVAAPSSQRQQKLD